MNNCDAARVHTETKSTYLDCNSIFVFRIILFYEIAYLLIWSQVTNLSLSLGMPFIHRRLFL